MKIEMLKISKYLRYNNNLAYGILAWAVKMTNWITTILTNNYLTILFVMLIADLILFNNYKSVCFYSKNYVILLFTILRTRNRAGID